VICAFLVVVSCPSRISPTAAPLPALPLAQLVLINISDHFTRTRANAVDPGAAVRVLGCLLGSQLGRTIDISNSFEMLLGADGAINKDFLDKKMEQCERQGVCACDGGGGGGACSSASAGFVCV
jgi:hypothetical protein